MSIRSITLVICVFLVNSTNAQRIIFIGDQREKDVDITQFKVVVQPDAHVIDYFSISNSTLIDFLKGNVDFGDFENKIIYKSHNEIDGDELTKKIKIAARNAAIDEVFLAFEDRMNHPGPPRPTKPAEDLTQAEIDRYNAAIKKFDEDDRPRVERVRGLLEHIKELGFPEDSEYIKKQLNQMKNANKTWMERQPVNIVRHQINP